MYIYFMVLFDNVPPLRRHFVYGVNCYQFAMGHHVPMAILQGVKGMPKLRVLDYIKAQPGNSYEQTRDAGQTTTATLQEKLIDGCLQDGLVRIKQDAALAEGWHKIAFYMRNSDKNFHFARVHENGTSEDKFPLLPPQRHDDIPKTTQGYRLKAFFAAPPGMRPWEMKHAAETVTIKLGRGSTDLALFKPNGNMNGSPPMVVDPAAKSALLIQQNLLVAMPPWNRQMHNFTP